MLIREVRPSDFDDIVGTFFSFFPEAEADPSFGLSLSREPPSMEDERKWFSSSLKEVEDGNLVMTVAEVDSHVVGWCIVHKVRPKSPLDHRGHVGLCVKKDFRDRGVGTALVKSSIEKCRGKFETLELTVLTVNRKAIAIYEKVGFKKYGVLPDAVKRAGRYFDDELMYLKL